MDFTKEQQDFIRKELSEFVELLNRTYPSYHFIPFAFLYKGTQNAQYLGFYKHAPRQYENGTKCFEDKFYWNFAKYPDFSIVLKEQNSKHITENIKIKNWYADFLKSLINTNELSDLFDHP